MADYSVIPAQVSKWQAALNALKNGSKDARLLFVGDSTTWGKGGSNHAEATYTTSVPALVSSLLRPICGLAQLGAAIAYGADADQIDDRWIIGAGWAENQGFGIGIWDGHNATGILTFSSTVPCDSFDVYYIGFPAGGTATMAATGGIPVNVNMLNNNPGIYKQRVTAGSLASSNQLSIAVGSAPNVNIISIEPTRTDAHSLHVGNYGFSGAATPQFVSFPNDYGSIPFIKAYAPDLTIISLGLNDMNSGVSADTYKANLQMLITAAQVSGDVVLTTFPPSQQAALFSQEPGFVAAMKAVAATNNLGVIDVFANFGSAYNQPLMSDPVHPNNAGYAQWAQLTARAITPPQSNRYIPRHANIRR